MTKRGEEHIPRFFRKAVDEAGREVWLYNGTYWRLRKDPGFANTQNLDLLSLHHQQDSKKNMRTVYQYKRGPVVDGKVL
ncbi:hypothetical protein INR49_001021 [Caranx melampygus]|nr:hypothetical protein INR49_001021 [Caranx melampygus]